MVKIARKLFDDWDVNLMIGIMVIAILGMAYMSSSIVSAVNSSESITHIK